MSPWRGSHLSSTKAIFEPSADQAGDAFGYLPKVSCLRFSPEGETVKIWWVPAASRPTKAMSPFSPGKVARAGSCATTSATHAASAAATSINTATDDRRGKPNLLELDASTALLLLARRSAGEGDTVCRGASPSRNIRSIPGRGVGRLGRTAHIPARMGPIHRSAWRDCLEPRYAGRIARFSVARSARNGALLPRSAGL